MKDEEHNYEVEQDIMKNQIFPFAKREKAHLNSVESMAAHPSLKTFATGSHDKTIKLWDVNTFKETATLAEHKYLSILMQGRRLVIGLQPRWKLACLWKPRQPSFIVGY